MSSFWTTNAVVIGFLGADLVTGSGRVKTLLLTAGNLAGMITA